MALSNIFNEPRREIIESAIGLAIVGAVIWADYGFARWVERLAGYDANASAEFPWPIAMIFGVGVGGLVLFMLILTHAIGESVCNRLERNGIRLRPRMRY